MFDPSKMDPKVLMELSSLVQQLPPAQLQRMQSLMHNMMAGFDVRKDMEEFEKTLPPGFREKLTSLMMSSGMPPMQAGSPFGLNQADTSAASSIGTAGSSTEMDVREARLTILRAVAGGQMAPEEAERLLFSP